MRIILHRDRRYHSLHGALYTLVIDGSYHVTSSRASLVDALDALQGAP